MAQIATNIEQSKHLLELRLNPETANMFIENGICYPKEEGYTDIENTIPSWSLGALLKLLREYNDCNKLDIFSNRSQKWQITISYYDCVWKEHEEVNMNLFEAVYNTIVWLLENGYIKTEKK